MFVMTKRTASFCLQTHQLSCDRLWLNLFSGMKAQNQAVNFVFENVPDQYVRLYRIENVSASSIVSYSSVKS